DGAVGGRGGGQLAGGGRAPRGVRGERRRLEGGAAGVDGAGGGEPGDGEGFAGLGGVGGGDGGELEVPAHHRRRRRETGVGAVELFAGEREGVEPRVVVGRGRVRGIAHVQPLDRDDGVDAVADRQRDREVAGGGRRVALRDRRRRRIAGRGGARGV